MHFLKNSCVNFTNKTAFTGNNYGQNINDALKLPTNGDFCQTKTVNFLKQNLEYERW